MKLEKELLNQYGKIELNEDENKALEDWAKTYAKKYKFVGYLDDGKDIKS